MDRGNGSGQWIDEVATVRWALARWALAILWCVLGCGCSASTLTSKPTTDGEQSPAGRSKSEIVVSTAASTAEVMEALVQKFGQNHDVLVHVNRGASNMLAMQIQQGANVDLFLSASDKLSQELQQQGYVATSEPLLTNQLVLVAASQDHRILLQPADLLHDDFRRLAIAGENVPAGIYASQALSRLGLLDALASQHKLVRGNDVRSVLGYLTRGEVELAIVYRSDVAMVPGVREVLAIDPALHDPIIYSWSLMRQAKEKKAALQLFAFVQSEEAMILFREFQLAPYQHGN